MRDFSNYCLHLSDFDSEKHLCKYADEEGNYCNADADKCHLNKSLEEGHALRHRGVIGEDGDYEDNHAKHTEESYEVVLEKQIGKYQERNREQIRDSRIATGFQGVRPTLASGGEELA